MSILVYISLAPLLLVMALVFRARPPKGINSIYGYRTRRSMQSDGSWKMANDYSTILLVRFCILLNVIQAAFFIILKMETAVLITCVVMISGLIAIMPMVEKKLKDSGYD